MSSSNCAAWRFVRLRLSMPLSSVYVYSDTSRAPPLGRKGRIAAIRGQHIDSRSFGGSLKGTCASVPAVWRPCQTTAHRFTKQRVRLMRLQRLFVPVLFVALASVAGQSDAQTTFTV